MTPDEYRNAVKALNEQHAKALRKLNGEYAESEKKYNEGDVVKLRDGTFMAIERIYVCDRPRRFPTVAYEGPEVDEHGNEPKRQKWWCVYDDSIV